LSGRVAERAVSKALRPLLHKPVSRSPVVKMCCAQDENVRAC
jgi:hypothetical protein